ncbi:fused response regulator/phosphatase [Nocardia sp. CDC159]|uniref:Fused response regulator/phosphatase n=1 Tax=Nocardia pulmonis TaxID=2951408 RepID=A0A9X2E9B1_9NOCA|nr:MULTISPECIES: fused response regulator/phosphatase [Nocardia]MCM6774166.1 fused response regulator/phosphatase [Nocardia pulmonis]MCM6787053.1 fused response regulator/phosphatase [Nocardia sp. CDC159]
MDPRWAWQEPWMLLVEDDAGDALLVQELVTDGAPGLRLDWVRSLAEAGPRLETESPDCVLLDLHLPDAHGLEALARIREYTDAAVVVMTGLDEQETGLAAVAAGAQDYLVKGRVEPELFGRAIRYAIQRKQVERTAAALQASQLRAQENARLERGLLPTPLLPADSGVSVQSRYRPGRAHALLGGDFYDVVQDGDGTVHAVIGDVSGHGPDAAATGVALRLAWRTLVLSGVTGARQLRVLEQVLLAERTDRQTFATATSLILEPDTRTVRVQRAGHPGMVLRSGTELKWVEVPGGPALGFLPDYAEWPIQELKLPIDSALMLFTDGLFEGCTGAERERLGEEGMLDIARAVATEQPETFIDELIGRIEELAGAAGGLDDDLAILYLRWRDGEWIR